MRSQGEERPSMFEKFTDKARRVMNIAQDEARNLGRMFVGTEHLLLALIKEKDGIASQALAKLDVTYDETLATVRGLTNDDGEPTSGGHIPFTPRAKRVLEGSYREMMSHGQTYIATEHLLLGIVAEGNGRAMEALGRMGVLVLVAASAHRRKPGVGQSTAMRSKRPSSPVPESTGFPHL